MSIENRNKPSFRLPVAVLQALEAAGEDVNELAQRLLILHAVKSETMDPAIAKTIVMRQKLGDRLVEIARARKLVHGITADNNYAAIAEAEADPEFKKAYIELVGDGKLTPISDERDEIHREFGMRICQAVGSKVARNGGGRPIKKRVKNSIIKSYTMMIAEPPALSPNRAARPVRSMNQRPLRCSN